MKVAFFTYPAAFQNIGGGEIVLIKMREYLEKEGLRVDLFDTWRSRVEDYDILHVFGSVKDCLGLVRVANARRVPVVTTPIWWSDFRRAFHSEGSFRTKADLVLRHAAKLVFPAIPSSRRRLLLASDLLLPNSEMEKKEVARQFAIPAEKMRVVYNGVDRSFLDADPELFRRKFGGEPFVLGVGRVEPRKNQLTLIRAVKKIGALKLVLIGSPVSGYEDYFELCRREGEGFVTFLPTIPHEEPMLRSAYGACRLFVLQGWFETPGLAALEAVLAGAKVVITSGGSTREYFRDFADYFDPSSVQDLANKISRNWEASVHPALKEHVLRHFTWEAVAKETARAYGDIRS